MFQPTIQATNDSMRVITSHAMAGEEKHHSRLMKMCQRNKIPMQIPNTHNNGKMYDFIIFLNFLFIQSKY